MDILIIGLLMFFFIRIGIKKSNEKKMIGEPKFIELISKAKEISLKVSNSQKYLDENDRLMFIKELEDIISLLKAYNISKSNKYYSVFADVIKIQQNLKDIFKNLNEKFVEHELMRFSSLFDDIDGKSLDNQQRRAIVTDELHNLVIAGAGSGKTLTISGKVKYLLSKGILPQQILLITFTKKAAEEMAERIRNRLSMEIKATTFHKLGLDIISKNMERRPDISDCLESVVEDYFRNEIINSESKSRHLLEFFAYYINLPVDIEKCKTLGEHIELEKSADLETIKSKYEKELALNKTSFIGERMKSIEEVMIANFLFLHGVEYQYECLYPVKSEDRYRKPYCPDFYLPKYGIYLEHFGINENNECPWLSKIESDKYIEDMEWKREFHIKHETQLIETYSYYQNQGILFEKLEELLLNNGVEFKKVDDSEILQQVYYRKVDKSVKEFSKLICSFIKQYKSNEYALEGFEALKKNARSEKITYFRERTILFLSIAEQIYQHYELVLKKSGSIDFSDMITKATQIIEENKGDLEYKYVIIDEYQDLGYDRYKLVRAILNNTGAKLMCVGDDWQSIYRFAGADVNLFSSFSKYWGITEMLRIEKTYRNSQELIDIAGEFVMSNPKQITKSLKSNINCENPVKLIYYKNNYAQAVIKALDDIVHRCGKNSTVFLIGRINSDIELLKSQDVTELSFNKNNEIKYLEVPDLKIMFITAHKSKGLEADNVIIINMQNKTLGFPNKIADDPILQLVLSQSDSYPYAEERRLMYVAMTRTRNRTYLIVPDKHPSVFISELESKCTKIYMEGTEFLSNNPLCPKCQSGRLVIRSSEATGEHFVGCTNYPVCNFTNNNLNIVNNPIRCKYCGGYLVERDGKYGKFYGCSNYPTCRNIVEMC